MLQQLRLVNFRAFTDFTVSFGDGAYLVGPNNAGKSTLLIAIRTADVLLRQAYRRNPTLTAKHGERSLSAYPLSLSEFPALRDSLRHEFGQAEALLELTWKSGAKLTAVWPNEEEEQDPFFYLERLQGMQVRTSAESRAGFPPLGVVPILTPVEHSEPLLNEAYVTRNIAGRLSSRHFRNHLRMLHDTQTLEEFFDWAKPWMGEVTFDRLGQHLGEGGLILEAFFFETGSRVPKELVWSGDGVQVWLQILLHVHRVRHCNTIVLDEPEVYLHPDLQRRLVHLLESTGRQVVVATHSSEVVAEADSRLVTLVDKSRRRALRARKDADLEVLSATLGTAFNLRLAKALRSRVALFLEGADMTIMRRLAKTLGLTRLEREDGITVVPLQGYSRWSQVEPFAWLCRELLPDALKIWVVLDRDYRSDAVAAGVEGKFRAAGLNIHVWQRKELESYLITSSVISRLSGVSLADVESMLVAVMSNMESEVFGRLLDERQREQVTGTRHAVTVTSQFKSEFDKSWESHDFRLRTCPPKRIISALNERLQAIGHQTISASALARAHHVREIQTEMADLLRAVNEAAG